MFKSNKTEIRIRIEIRIEIRIQSQKCTRLHIIPLPFLPISELKTLLTSSTLFASYKEDCAVH